MSKQLSSKARNYFDNYLRYAPRAENELEDWRERKRYLDQELDRLGVSDKDEKDEITRQYLGNEPVYAGGFFTEQVPEALSQGVDKFAMNVGAMGEYIGSKLDLPHGQARGQRMAARNRELLRKAPQFAESPEELEKQGFLSRIDDYTATALSDIVGSAPVGLAGVAGGLIGGVPGAVTGTTLALGGGALLEAGSTFSDYKAELKEEGFNEDEANKAATVAADEVAWANMTDAELLPYALAQGLSGPILGALSKIGRAGKLGKFGNRLKNFTPRKQAVAAGVAQVGTGSMQERRQLEVSESATGNPMERFSGFDTPEGRFATIVGGFAEAPISILEAATAKDRDSRVDPVQTGVLEEAKKAAVGTAENAEEVARQQQEAEEAQKAIQAQQKAEDEQRKREEKSLIEQLNFDNQKEAARTKRRQLLLNEAKVRSNYKKLQQQEAEREEAIREKRIKKTDVAKTNDQIIKAMDELDDLRTERSKKQQEVKEGKAKKREVGPITNKIKAKEKQLADLREKSKKGDAQDKVAADAQAKIEEGETKARNLRTVYEAIGRSMADAEQLRKTILEKRGRGEDFDADLQKFQEVRDELYGTGEVGGLIRQADNLQSETDPTGDIAAAPSDATAIDRRAAREGATEDALAAVLGRPPQTPAEQVAERMEPPVTQQSEQEAAGPKLPTDKQMEEVIFKGQPVDVDEFIPVGSDKFRVGDQVYPLSDIPEELIERMEQYQQDMRERKAEDADPRERSGTREIVPAERNPLFDPEQEAQPSYFTSASQATFNNDFIGETEERLAEEAADDIDVPMPGSMEEMGFIQPEPSKPTTKKEALPEQLTQKAFKELRSPVDEAETEIAEVVNQKREEVRKRVADELKARADLGDKQPRGMPMGSTMKLLNPVKAVQEIVKGEVVETQLSHEQLLLISKGLANERRKVAIDDAIKKVLASPPDLRVKSPKDATQESDTITQEEPISTPPVGGQVAGQTKPKKKKEGRIIPDKRKLQPDLTQETIDQQVQAFKERGGEVQQVEEVKKQPTKQQKTLEEFNQAVEQKEATDVQTSVDQPKATGRIRKRGSEEATTEEETTGEEVPGRDEGGVEEAGQQQRILEEAVAETKKNREKLKKELGKPQDLTSDEVRELIESQDPAEITDAYLNYHFREELGKPKAAKDQDIENRLKEEMEELGVDPERAIKDMEQFVYGRVLSFSRKPSKGAVTPAFGNMSKLQAQAAIQGMKQVVKNLNEKSFMSEKGDYIHVVADKNEALQKLEELGEPRSRGELAADIQDNPNAIIEGFLTPGGNVILIADQMEGKDLKTAVERMVEVVFHEVIGHKGLRGLMGTDYQTFIEEYGKQNRRDIQRWLKEPAAAGYTDRNFFQQTEEYIAINFAEKGAQEIGWRENFANSIANKLGLGKYSNTALKKAMQVIEGDLAGYGGSILDGANIGFQAEAVNLTDDEKEDGSYKPQELNYGNSYSRKEYQDALTKTGLTHNALIASKMGNYPNYLNSVVNSMQKMQQKFNSGNLEVRDVAKAYFITISSMGKKEQPRATVEARLRQTVGSSFKELPSHFVEDYNGKQVVRPEEQAAWALTTPLGQRLLKDLDNGKYDTAGWTNLAKNYFSGTYGRNDLLKPGYLSGKGGGFPLSRVKEITDAVNAQPGDTDNLYGQMLKFQGIGEGKVGFISSMFGVGGMLTLDAVELNAWMTGQGDITPLTLAADKEIGMRNQDSILDIQRKAQQEADRIAANTDLSDKERGALVAKVNKEKNRDLNSERMRIRIEYLGGERKGEGVPNQLTPEQRERLRLRYLFKDANKDDQAQLRDIVAQNFKDIRDDGNLPPSQGMQQIPVDLFDHIVHHWAWDTYKGVQTKHEGIYDAMLNFSRRVEQVDALMTHGELYSGDSTLSFSRKKLVDSGVPPKLAEELAGKKMVILTADRTKYGPYTGMNPGSTIDLYMYGGPGYGENNINTGAVWASAKGAANKFLKHAKAQADNGLFGVSLLLPENHMGSKGVFQAFIAELKEGKQLGTYDWDAANKLAATWAASKTVLGPFPDATKTKDIIELFEGILANVGHQKRPPLIKPIWNAAEGNKKGWSGAGVAQIGKHVLRETSDARFLNTPYGSLIGLGQINPKEETAKASKFGIPEHPSYNTVIPGKFLTMLKNPMPLFDYGFDWIINKAEARPDILELAKDSKGKPIREFETSKGGKYTGPSQTKTVMGSFMASTQGSVQEIAKDVLTQVPDDAPNLTYSRRTKPDPKKTVKAYKLFRVKKTKKGDLFPLFVRANEPAEVGVWLDADIGKMAESGKVQSSLGELAFRPGWHAGDAPFSHHIGSGKPPTYRPENQVWAEVEMAADVDWQTEANKRAKRYKSDSKATGMKKGDIIPKTAEIKDGIPEDGYYRYKTNPNMVGEWLIGGAIKISRILTDEETLKINQEKGILDKEGNLAVDLPRNKPLDLEAYGFDPDQLTFSRRQGIGATIDALEAQASRAVNVFWDKSVVLDKAYRAAMDFAEPMSQIPRLKEYLAARRRLRGVIDRNEDIANDVYNSLKDTKTPKLVYEFFITKGADPSTIPNAKERAVAVRAKKAIEEIGDRMVQAGLVEQETIDAMKGGYLPRVYLKYLLKDADANSMFRNNRRPSDLSYIKERKDIPEGIRKMILGEVEDAAYLSSRAIMQPGRDLALLDWMSWISTQSDWTLQQTLVDFDIQGEMSKIAKRVGGDGLVKQLGVTENRAVKRERISDEIKELREEIKQIKKENQTVPVKNQAKLLSAKNNELKELLKERDRLPSNFKASPYYLMAEAERIETQLLDNEQEILSDQERQVLKEIVEQMRDVGKKNINDIEQMGMTTDKKSGDISTKEWKQIPKGSKRYGKLRGMVVRAEIYDDIVGTFRMFPEPNASMSEKILGDGGYLAQANNIWKWSKVAANPPSYVRNFTSNLILMNLGGVRMQRLPGLIGKSLNTWTRKGKYYQIAKKHGLLSSGFSGNEIQMLENEYIEAQRRAATQGGLSGLAAMRIAADMFSKLQNFTGDAYGFVDGFGKIMMMTDAMENQGMNEADAAAYAEKWLFDYSHVGRNVQFLRTHALGSPFVTFTAKVAPRLLETARYKPWRFAPWVGLGYAVSEAVKESFDWDDEDVEAAFTALPEYLRQKGQSAVVPLPFKDENGRIQFLDISYLLPWGLFQEMGNELANGDLQGAFMSTGVFGGPTANLITAFSTNRDAFTQKEIVDRTKSPASQIGDMFTYAYNMAIPPFLNTEYGGIRRMYQALTGELDRYGEPTFTVEQAMGRLVGFNTTPLDLRQSRQDNIRRYERELNDLKRNKTRDLRRAYRMKKGREDINDIVQEYNELINTKRDELIEYRKKSRLPENA